MARTKEQRAAYMRAYRDAHKAELAAQNKAYYEAHKAEVAVRTKAYDEAHRDERKAYREVHKEEYKARYKAWREAHKEEYKAQKKAYAKLPQVIIKRYQKGAKTRNLPWELSDAHAFELFTCDCVFCGRKAIEGDLNGIDRVDSSKGYVNGNVQSCCTACNIAKLDRSDADYIEHCRRVVAHQAEKSLHRTQRRATTTHSCTP